VVKKMKKFLAAALILLAGAANAAGLLYGVDRTDDSLIKIDLDTLSTTTVGSLGTNENFGGLAFDSSTGVMYLSGGRNNTSIYTVDLNTGAATLLGNHGVNDVFGLAFDSTNNTLYGTATSGNLYSFSTSNGGSTLIGYTGQNIGGLAYDSDLDRLVGLRTAGISMFEINRSDGSVSFLATGLPSTNDVGFTYDYDNDLFYSLGLNGTLHSYDPSSYSNSLVASGLPDIDGLTYVSAVPVPAAVWLFGSGLGLLGFLRRKAAVS